jgi:hypothetical protein
MTSCLVQSAGTEIVTPYGRDELTSVLAGAEVLIGAGELTGTDVLTGAGVPCPEFVVHPVKSTDRDTSTMTAMPMQG